MLKVLVNSKEFDFDVVVNMMDNEIREALHSEMAPCSEQEFVNSYAKAHNEKHNEIFDLN